MRWLYLHFPYLALEQQTRYWPSPKPPSVMLDSSGKQVMLADPPAQAAGIQSGMSLATATALVPELLCLEASDRQCQTALTQTAAMLYRQVAQIALHPSQGLLLEMNTMRRLHPDLDSLQVALIQQVQAMGFTVQASRGNNPQAARLLAENGDSTVGITTEQAEAKLLALPIQHCRLPAETAMSLEKMGIRTLGEFMALPDASVGRRFGKTLLQWRAQLNGTLADPQTWYVPPQRFHRHVELHEDIRYTQGLLFPLQMVFRELEHYLMNAQQCTDEIHLRLNYRAHPAKRIALGSAVGTHKAEEWLKIAQLKLERLTLDAEVMHFDVKVRRLLPLVPEALSVLHTTDERATRPSALRRFTSHLQARLGHASVRQLRLRADHRPHLSVREQVLQAAEPSTAQYNPPGSGWPRRRPYWLLYQPQPVARQQLSLLGGPERIKTGWWDAHAVCRDYYRAQLPDRSLCWVYRQPDQQWFIAGYFG
ncbi:Y-family DNA polymerase [Salinispirillum marinum]|uniref:Y-family DNA polymerase n=2 Tax=Saccharospirillaceae TaxID=255527 RepID=A0ABV8BG92_9GAMM